MAGELCPGTGESAPTAGVLCLGLVVMLGLDVPTGRLSRPEVRCTGDGTSSVSLLGLGVSGGPPASEPLPAPPLGLSVREFCLLRSDLILAASESPRARLNDLLISDSSRFRPASPGISGNSLVALPCLNSESSKRSRAGFAK